MTNPCEFIVNGVVTGASQMFHVIGRCGDSSFRVGDVFDQLAFPGEEAQSVQLRVTRITAYQRSIDEIGWGMTATVDVEGSGVDQLRPRAVLVVSHPQEPQSVQQSVKVQATSDV
ncbi:hypothetical protein ETAA8_20050 [Anatilimnocola aggregata]|uniref:Uncharacterized protein n=1 Tax=Anatilimnocola aggregata TaxID=2528021 RepID=A0A517Y9Q3_9BACT|nr:hypothetical protein [Anatilimnocola aggregata]QDU26921.1 hypothetical protein ETAA8_20050 [Anatilimnocola aggregata]